MTAAVDRYVSRAAPLLVTTDLHLDEYPFFIAEGSFEPGEVTWKRHEVESAFVHGEYEISAVKKSENIEATIYVFGASQVELQTNVDTLIDAFTQRTFTLTADYGDSGVLWKWNCRRANYKWRQNAWTPSSANAAATVFLSFPRHPIPVAGPF